MTLGTEGPAWRSGISALRGQVVKLPPIGRCILLLFMCQAAIVFGVPNGEFTTATQSHRILVGHSARLDCNLPSAAQDTDVFIVQWKKQGSPSPVLLWRRGQSEREGRGYEGRVSLSGTAALAVVDIRRTDAGVYDCQVWDVNGHPRVNGTVVHLDVMDVIPRFTRLPQSALMAPGSIAEFLCSVEPAPTSLRWLLDDRPVSAPGVVASSGGRLQVAVSLDPRVQLVQSGAYRCVAEWESAVLTSNPANLSVAVISQFKEQQPVHLSAIEGGYSVIPGSIPDSVPLATVVVKHNGTTLPQSSLRTILMPSGNLHIQNVQAADSGWYQFSAQNPVTREWVTAKHVVTLTVTAPDKGSSAQLLAASKKANVAVLGSNISLECAANGSPSPRISWDKYGGTLPAGRYQQILGNLFLYDLRPNDTGTYICEAQNAVGPSVKTIASLDVLEVPEIHRWTTEYEVREREDVVLECHTKGLTTKPEIRWMHRGSYVINSDIVLLKESRLNIRYAQREHAGFYQCFASSEAGVMHATTLLRVVPRSAPNEDDVAVAASAARGHRREHGPHVLDNNWGPPVGRNSTFPFIKEDDDVDKSELYPVAEETVGVDADDWPIHNAKRNRKKNRKKSKKRKYGSDDANSRVVMIPPTKPKVTKLTDESVMVRWEVPPNSGLPIQFFKVQYRDLTERSDWMTIDEDIPPHVFSYEVLNLRTGRTYRFRIAAVYSNNDNNRGPNSHKFVLQKDPPMKKPIIGPTISHVEAIAPSAISVQWQYLVIDEVLIEGFFIYYRATTSAGPYTKITVLGANTRSYIISHLLPETAYDVKMQSFNSAGTSDFSSIHTEKTWSSPDTIHRTDDTSYPTRPTPVSNTASSDRMLYTIFGSILGALTLSLVIFVTYCSWKQRRRQKRRAINSSRTAENGNLRDLGKYAAVNGTPVANGHAPRGNGMFLWDKVGRDDHNHIHVMETSLVEPPTARTVQNNNNNVEVAVVADQGGAGGELDAVRDTEDDEVHLELHAHVDDPASAHPLIHRPVLESQADYDDDYIVEAEDVEDKKGVQ